MLLNKIVLSKTPPTSPNTVWAKPSNGGVSLYTYNNNKWDPILSMDDMGTDNPDDDLPGKVITLELFDETILGLKDYVSENYASNTRVFITTPPATLNAQVDYYYCIGGNGVVVDTMTIQLPSIADYENKTKNVSFFMIMGSAPAVTFVSAGTERIRYQKDFALEAERGYEVNALWNSHAWVIAAVEIEIPETRVVATVNVTDTSGTTLVLGNTSNISAVEIDGVEQQSVETGHAFSTTGEHTIKYTLTDPTSIGNNAFQYCSDLTSITIPDSVSSIGEYTFFGCSGLTSVTIPNTVTTIGNEAFYYCSGLTSITIPNSVTNIGEHAFSQCTGLTSVTIGSGVTSIGSSAFNGCSGLTSITIPDSVTSIGNEAFYQCTGLRDVTIGSGVTNIGNQAFNSCSSLTSIVVDSANTVFDSRDNCNAIINTSTNELIKGCKNTVIPNTVTSIGRNAFFECTGLTSISIPNSVTSIGQSAFYQCTGLTSITIPDSVTSIGSAAFNSCSSLRTVTIGNGVTSIGQSAFYQCTGLTSITIPDSVTSIGSAAFSQCKGLTNITIPDSVTSIGSAAFSQCKGLISVSIPSSVTTIGEYAFSQCTGLISVSIPSSVTTIVNGVFEGCGLTSITIPDSVTSIGNDAFNSCKGLTSITIPDSVTSIGSSAFYECTNLTSITSLAATAPTIQSGTFNAIKTGGTLTVPSGSTGYDVWMGTGDYYLGKYGWTKVEQ